MMEVEKFVVESQLYYIVSFPCTVTTHRYLNTNDEVSL